MAYIAKTKKQFEAYFKSEILPHVKTQYEQDNRIDYPARREEWNNCIDELLKNRQLPRNAENWCCPW
jgi:hypothetical protein